MACKTFERSDDDHPNKCKNCGEYPSAHLRDAIARQSDKTARQVAQGRRKSGKGGKGKGKR